MVHGNGVWFTFGLYCVTLSPKAWLDQCRLKRPIFILSFGNWRRSRSEKKGIWAKDDVNGSCIYQYRRSPPIPVLFFQVLWQCLFDRVKLASYIIVGGRPSSTVVDSMALVNALHRKVPKPKSTGASASFGRVQRLFVRTFRKPWHSLTNDLQLTPYGRRKDLQVLKVPESGMQEHHRAALPNSQFSFHKHALKSMGHGLEVIRNALAWVLRKGQILLWTFSHWLLNEAVLWSRSKGWLKIAKGCHRSINALKKRKMRNYVWLSVWHSKAGSTPIIDWFESSEVRADGADGLDRKEQRRMVQACGSGKTLVRNRYCWMDPGGKRHRQTLGNVSNALCSPPDMSARAMEESILRGYEQIYGSLWFLLLCFLE